MVGDTVVRAAGRRIHRDADFLENIPRRFDQLGPCFISLWQPLDNGEWMEPGMAKTSRPCSAASRAVISVPLRSAASTTSTPRASPAMIRLRRGKLEASGGVPSANSETIAPFSAMAWASAWLRAG